MAITQDRLIALLSSWKLRLQAWSVDSRLSAAAKEALLLGVTPEQLVLLTSHWAGRDFSELPLIELLAAEAMPGAAAAYAASTGIIYLNENWLASATEEQVLRALTEELGHHLDATLNSGDSPGDEGEFFSRVLLDSALTAAERVAIRRQNDSTLIWVDGQWIAAEAAFSWPQQAGGSSTDWGYSISSFADGSSVILGVFTESASFGSTTLASAVAGFEAVNARLNSDGSYAWVNSGGGGNSISSRLDGSFLVTGGFSGTRSFGAVTLASVGGQDAFIANLNQDGSYAWITQSTGAGSELGNDIVALADGSSLIAGSFTGTAVLGATSLVATGLKAASRLS